MVPCWVPMLPTQYLQCPQHSVTWMWHWVPTLGATLLSQGPQEDLYKEPFLAVWHIVPNVCSTVS